ncbi:MAG: restriction endonuclease subunit S, partial [Candidatus Methanoperedens sp.]
VVKYVQADSYDSLLKGDVLFNNTNSPELIGKTAYIKEDTNWAFSNHMTRIRLNKSFLNSAWISYYLHSLFLKGVFKTSCTHHVNQASINSTSLAQKVPIPLPPLPEQRAIVSKIEQLFSDLDNGIENFKKAQAQLKLYRQSVLKAACEGRLVPTEAELARAEGREYEAADVLLARILKERREKWNGKGKYKEPAALDTNELSELPEGWASARFDMVCYKIQDGSHFSPKIQYNTRGDGTYLYITAKNIKENGLTLSDVTYVDSSFHQSIYGRCNPEKGDVLLTKDGVKTGMAVINNLEEEFSLLSSVALFKSNKNILNSYYLKHFLNSPIGFKMTTGQMTGTAIKRIILDKIRTSYIPLPPLAEQRRIVAEVERRLSVSDKMEATITESLQKAESLRQSILKKAFEGKLLNKNELEKARNAPDWEPAEKLLERIKAEKMNIKTKTRI